MKYPISVHLHSDLVEEPAVAKQAIELQGEALMSCSVMTEVVF